MVTGDKAKQPRKVWDNPEAARLIEAASAETDHGKRQAIFDQLHCLFLADAPSIPLYNGLTSAPSAATSRATGPGR